MQTRTQLFLDRSIVKPFIICLNLFVRVLGKILRIDHSLDKKFKVIAVCKYKGMGSIIQTTPLLQTLRKNFPDAKIIFISTEANKELLKKIKVIDEIVTVNDSSITRLLASCPGFILKLVRLRIEVYLDLEIYSNFSSLITTLSIAKNRIGYYYRSSNYRLGIYTHMMFFNIRTEVSQAYLQLARLLDCKEIVEELISFQKIDQSVLNSNSIIRGKYIVINPNASDLRVERRWPKENFVLLIDKLLSLSGDYSIVLIGNSKEAGYVSSIIKVHRINSRVHSLAGLTTLNELISVIEHADLVITNDTGPMHIAFATGTKTVSLFGPCSPEQHPGGKNNYSIYKKVYCSPCVHEFMIPPCKGNNQCMKLIEVNEVFEAILKMLSASVNLKSYDKDETKYDSSGNYVLGSLVR